VRTELQKKEERGGRPEGGDGVLLPASTRWAFERRAHGLKISINMTLYNLILINTNEAEGEFLSPEKRKGIIRGGVM